MERITRIELVSTVWKTVVIPIYDTCFCHFIISHNSPKVNIFRENIGETLPISPMWEICTTKDRYNCSIWHARTDLNKPFDEKIVCFVCKFFKTGPNVRIPPNCIDPSTSDVVFYNIQSIKSNIDNMMELLATSN